MACPPPASPFLIVLTWTRPVQPDISFYTDRIKESSGVPRDHGLYTATIGGLFVMGWISGEVRSWVTLGDQWGNVGFGVVVDKVREM